MFQHFIELRIRLIKSSICLLVVFTGCLVFSKQLYHWLATPLLNNVSNMIATSVTSPFVIPMKLSFAVSMVICLPIMLFQIWSFIAPGLYKSEKRKILPLVVISCLLFYCGMAFAFYVICPVAIKFFSNAAPTGVKVMTDISNYFQFTLNMLFSCGVAFQIPIITHVLLRNNIISKKQLSKSRPYIIILAFTLGMLLTPPDVVSQILLAIPIWMLFELGCFFSSSN